MARGERIEKGKMILRYEAESVRLFLKGITAEDALDTLAAVTIIAFVILAFILDGLLGVVPENLSVMYILMGIYLSVYLVHKFREMR